VTYKFSFAPMPTITDFHTTLDAAHVLQGQGLDPARARPEIVAAAQGVLDEAQSLLAPAALYEIVPVREFRHHTVILGDGTSLEGTLVARALAGAAEIALAVCTVGPALDARVSAHFAAGDSLHALALDGAGIGALAQVSGAVGERICDEANARGLRTGMRASPGQEGWPLEQQMILFDLVPAQKIGVQLTESCLMLPRKSVSFVVGLGPEMRADATACDFCSKRDRCRWRAGRR
jgi:hypothetical protein